MNIRRSRATVEAGIPWLDYVAGHVTGKLLVWMGIRAAKRGDWHESNHCLMGLYAGNSLHEEGPCQLPSHMQHGKAKHGDNVTFQLLIEDAA